jgi:MFS family permease
MILSQEKRNVVVLAVCQVLFNTGRGLTFLVAAIASAAMLGDDLRLATAPITMMLIGTAAGTLPSAHLMRRFGRKWGFVAGSLIGALGGLLAMSALTDQNFILFNVAILLFGVYSGFAQQYRFAAADTASAEFKAKAIALVLAAGVVGAFTGPEAGRLGKELWGADFVGSFAILTVVTLLSGLAVLGIDIPKLTKQEYADPGRPLGVIFRQPAVIVAVITASLGYMVMTFLMTATPIAMTVGAHHGLDSTAFVIEWHVVGMFAPGFFSGTLIKRYGTLRIIAIGNALLLAAVAAALSGTGFWHFWLSLFFLGVGWNFAFTGGTTLLTEIDTPSERAKLQGTNDFIVFTLLAFASLFSGTVYHLLGWVWVNLLALPMIVISLAAVLWLAALRRRGGDLEAKPAE